MSVFNPILEKTLANLKSRSFNAILVKDTLEANKAVCQLVPIPASVGIGDSATLRHMGIIDELAKRGNLILDPFTPNIIEGIDSDKEKYKEFRLIQWNCLHADIFMSSSNAVTEDGKIVSIDGGGNRVAAMIYGPAHVILCVGRNKIVKDEQEAEVRIKNVIAVAHGRNHLNKDGTAPSAPCVKVGKCVDCRGAVRSCNAKVVLEHKTRLTELSVILIDQDIGLGWDPSWEKARIDAIYENYKRYSPQIKYPLNRKWR